MIGDEIQTALYSALIGAGVAGGRIYDGVPKGTEFPYVTIGNEQVIDESDQCQSAWDVIETLYCWSRPDEGSKREVKQLAAAVVSAVTGISSVAGFSLVSIDHENSLFRRDSDGLTEQAVITFRVTIGPA